MLQQLLLSPPHLPAGFGEHCQGGGWCSGSSSSCFEEQGAEPFLQQPCCLASAADERTCGKCAAYAQLLRLRCDSPPSLCASSPSAAVLSHVSPPKSNELERAAAAAASVRADRQRCTAAAASAPCCCCCLYYNHCSSSNNSSEVWGSLPVPLPEDSCDFGAACDSCVALRETPSPLSGEEEGAPQLWGPEEEAWGLCDCWAAPSRCTATGGGPEHELRAAAAGVGALLLQLPSNLICDAALLTSAPSPINANGGSMGPLPPSRADVAAVSTDGCQQRRATAHNRSSSTCFWVFDSEVYRHSRGEAVDELLRLEGDLLIHTDGVAAGGAAEEAAAAFPHCCERQQLRQQQQELPQHFEQLSPLPMSSCPSRCASPLQQTQPEQRQEQQLLLQPIELRIKSSSAGGDREKSQAAAQHQSLAAGRKPRLRRRRVSDTPATQKQQQQQRFAAVGCCCGRQPCVCSQQQQQHATGLFSQECEGAAVGQDCYQQQQQQETLLLPVQKRKRLTSSTIAESGSDEWTIARQEQWSGDGPLAQTMLLSSEEQQQQQLSPASYYDFSCSPITAAAAVHQQQQQQQQHGSSIAANCSVCGAAANCCSCGSLGLEQQRQHLGLHNLVEQGISQQLSHDSSATAAEATVVTAAAAAAGVGSKDCSKDASSPAAAASPKAPVAPSVAGGGPFVCSIDIPVCLPQFEDSTDCLSLLNLTEAQWQQFRAQGMFKLGDKGRAIIKSRISRQLRVFPHLRKRASSVAGVRCATTKQLFQLAQICGLYDVLPPQFQPDSFRNAQQDQQQQQSRQASPQQPEQQDAAAVVTPFSSVTTSTSTLAEGGRGSTAAAAAAPAALLMPDFDGPSSGGSSSSNAGFWPPVIGEQQQLLMLESMQQSHQQAFCEQQQQLQLSLM